ncbi:MAG TPA: tetratricopeptide repeat protein, partial [Herpetosiphonaceae bacterium]
AARLREYLHPALAARLATGNDDFLNEHRTVTILFVRFQSFDYDRDPEVSAKLQAYLGDAARRVRAYDGYLQQIDIGDKGSTYLVLFGSPVAHEDDPERALRCALELRQAGRAAGIDTAIGINSGSVYCGLVGAQSRREYTVIGDAVNLAARLMQAAGADQIIVSKAAAGSAAGAFRWQELPALSVKGRTAGVEVASLAGLAVQSAVRLQESAYSLPLVGRSAELAQIDRVIALAAEGRGQVLSISGAAGVGKSRLVAELLDRAEAAGFVSYAGACQSYAAQTPYVVWEPIWRAFFALEADWPAEDQRRVLSLQLGLIDPDFVERLPVLGRVFHLAWADTELTRALDSQMGKESCETLLTDCLRARAQATPLLLILEDCHWIDALSQDLFAAVSRAIADAPILLARVARDANPAPASRSNHSEIRLDPIGAEEARQLIRNKAAQLLGDPALLSPALLDQLTARTEGNPFYLEELLTYLYGQGRAAAPAGEQIELPASLHSLILSRIDQLTEPQQLTLKVASIIGRLFKAAWLWEAYPYLGPPEHIRRDLRILDQLDLTQQDASDADLAYLFRHSVTHEVAYESLAHSTRNQLHEHLAQFIEQSGDPRQSVDLLAYHYGRSQNLAKQREYFQRAAAAAQAVYANEAALAHYGRLLPLLDEPERIPALLSMGQIRELVGEWDAAGALYREAAELAERHELPSARASAVLALGSLLRKRGDYPLARETLEAALALFGKLGGAEGLGASAALAEIGQVHRLLSAHAAAHDYFEASLKLHQAAGDRAGIANVLGQQGMNAYAQGDYQTAIAFHQASLALRRELGDSQAIGVALNGLGIAAYSQGEYAAAHDYFSQSLALRRKIGDKLGIANCLNNLGVVAYELADYAAAHELYEESLALRRAIGTPGGIANSLNNLGYAALRQGRDGEAIGFLREAAALHASLGNQQGLAEAVTGLAGAAAGLGRSAPQPAWAARLCGFVDGILADRSSVLERTERTAYDQALAAAQAGLPGAEFAAALAAGRSLALDEIDQAAAAAFQVPAADRD